MTHFVATSGSVSAEFEFVVDSLGVPDMNTARLIKSNDDQVMRMAKNAIPQLRYEPAMKNGHAVPQISRYKMEIATEQEQVVRTP